MMRILVLGVGSIGKRHIGNLNLLGCKDIDVVDIDESSLDYVKNNFKVNKTFASLKDAVSSERYDTAFILTPPVYHIPMALELAEEGIDLFIEKPVSHNMEGVDDLIKLKEKKDLVVMVGYNLRFNPCLEKLQSYLVGGRLGKIHHIRAEFGQYLPDWRPQQDYRKNYTALREMGGGILLDGSHEIDYVLWLVNSVVKKVKAVYNKVSDLDIDVEDTAEIILEFESNALASIHLDMVERGYNRYCRVTGEKGSIKWIFRENTLEFFDGDSKQSVIEKYEHGSNHSYLKELEHFLDCVENREEPLSNLHTARKTLDLIEEIKGGD